MSALNRLGRNNKVTVDWVPGHTGILGNERADILAKDAIELSINEETRDVYWSFSLLKNRLRERLSELHTQHWINREDCRQAKMFLTGPSSKQSKFLLSLKRRDLQLISGVVTGHCTLNSHLRTLRIINSPTCGRCLEEDETAEHFLCSCPSYSTLRHKILGEYEIESSMLTEVELKDILTFAKRTGRFRETQ